MSVPLPPPPMTEPPPPPPPAEFGGADRINARPTQSHPAASTIIKAPVRYSLPQAPPEIPATEAELESAFEAEKAASLSAQDPEFQPDQSAVNEDAPRSLRPGQKGFAERLMSKYGWSKGSGLGANESGMLNPLRVQVEKQKKRPDSEGGGFVGPSGMGKIIASKKKGGGGSGSGDASTGEGRFGKMSEVVILKGMVDGMDLDAELGAGDGGLMQEIGEECAEKVCCHRLSCLNLTSIAQTLTTSSNNSTAAWNVFSLTANPHVKGRVCLSSSSSQANCLR